MAVSNCLFGQNKNPIEQQVIRSIPHKLMISRLIQIVQPVFDLNQQFLFLLLDDIMYLSQTGLVTINGNKILEKTWHGLLSRAKSRGAERLTNRRLQEFCNGQLRRFELLSVACSRKL